MGGARVALCVCVCELNCLPFPKCLYSLGLLREAASSQFRKNPLTGPENGVRAIQRAASTHVAPNKTHKRKRVAWFVRLLGFPEKNPLRQLHGIRGPLEFALCRAAFCFHPKESAPVNFTVLGLHVWLPTT